MSLSYQQAESLFYILGERIGCVVEKSHDLLVDLANSSIGPLSIECSFLPLLTKEDKRKNKRRSIDCSDRLILDDGLVIEGKISTLEKMWVFPIVELLRFVAC